VQLNQNPEEDLMNVWPGEPYPLGATWDGNGVNFAVFSRHVEKMELCLFSGADGGEQTCLPLTERTDEIWHAYLPYIGPGQRYGYRAHGPYDPGTGHRFNPAKLLLDPYAKAIDRPFRVPDEAFGYKFGEPEADLTIDDRDSALVVAKSVVVDPTYDWEGDQLLRIPPHETIIYEVHVKGFTARHPDVPEELRGTYAGLASPPVIDYLRSLGITAVELLPMHAFVTDRHLEKQGLTNYWGYNSIGFLAPDARYASRGTCGEQVREFKDMVKAFHRAGLEVILDVVYNHTAEGNHAGPTLCFRGLDNAVYYRLVQDDQRHYMDYTGTGNTLNMMEPRVLQLIMDSLRYWVLEMHVDGFRFDLASALARELHEVDRLGSFFDTMHQDPVLSQVKLIAEPWDIGEGGYQVGNFPIGWAEWNGKYRDTIRDYWRGTDETIGEFAFRLTGSSDLYENGGRRPFASINFVTAHDGFTLRDLVSYNEKHNEANGEDNRDGESHNRSWNCGVEGPTDDPAVKALRARQSRNLLATLFLSHGIPMLLGGDEIGRTQGGNNNGYCQDNEISWYDWHSADRTLLEFTRRLIRLRRDHCVFRRRRWFQGRPIHGPETTDIAWFRPDAQPMSSADWASAFAKSLAVFLNGQGIQSPGPRGERIIDDSFYLLFNASHEPCTFRLPTQEFGRRWVQILDTTEPFSEERQESMAENAEVTVEGRALQVLRLVE
jgi:isoamylase